MQSIYQTLFQHNFSLASGWYCFLGGAAWMSSSQFFCWGLLRPPARSRWVSIGGCFAWPRRVPIGVCGAGAPGRFFSLLVICACAVFLGDTVYCLYLCRPLSSFRLVSHYAVLFQLGLMVSINVIGLVMICLVTSISV